MVLLWCGCAFGVTEQSFRVKTDNVPQAQIAGSLWRADGTPQWRASAANTVSRCSVRCSPA